MEATPLDWTLIRPIAISLALGAIIGLERQSHRDPDRALGSVGVRTFALAAVLGTSTALIEEILPSIFPGIFYVVGGGYFALLVAFFWQERRATGHEVGITTQVSAMMVFIIGVIVPNNMLFAASLAVIVAIVLALKRYTNKFVQLLTPEEIISTMKFLLVTVVLLPLLPNQPVDPWGWYNPREIWLLVVLITGISFMAYFAIRFMGARRGLTLTGVLGGMASSTAVTLAMSRQVRHQPESRTMVLSSAFAIMLATAFMFVRVSTAVAVVNLALVGTLWIPFVAMAIPGSLIAGGMWFVLSRHIKKENENPEAEQEATPDEEIDDEGDEKEEGDQPKLEIRNPFEFVPAVKFAALLMVIIGVANLLQDLFGEGATFLVAMVGGLAETNAISLTLAGMELDGNLSATLATQGIVIAILANSIVKAGLATLVGSRRLGIYVSLGLLPIFAVGLTAAFLL